MKLVLCIPAGSGTSAKVLDRSTEVRVEQVTKPGVPDRDSEAKVPCDHLFQTVHFRAAVLVPSFLFDSHLRICR